jgi:hypothetical protein
VKKSEALENQVMARVTRSLLAALLDIDLRCTQERIASQIGRRRGKDEFLRGALERISQRARKALEDATGGEVLAFEKSLRELSAARYDNPNKCPVCDGINDLSGEDRYSNHLLEAGTKCQSCGHVGHWIHGFFEGPEPGDAEFDDVSAEQ